MAMVRRAFIWVMVVLALVGVCGWVRSCWWSDRVFGVRANEAGISTWSVGTARGQVGFEYTWQKQVAFLPLDEWKVEWSQSANPAEGTLGFYWNYRASEKHYNSLYAGRPPGLGLIEVRVPWAMAVILPAAAALAAWRRRRRFGAGQCRKCGYDLRASPGRCPECGAGSEAGGEKKVELGSEDPTTSR